MCTHYIYIYTHTLHVCLHTFAHMHIYACMHLHTHVCLHACMNMYTHAYLCTDIHLHTQVHIYRYMCGYFGNTTAKQYLKDASRKMKYFCKVLLATKTNREERIKVLIG